MIKKSPQEWLESRDQAFHISDELVKRWNERLTLDSPFMKERFERGGIHIILHVLLKGTGERWGLCFESSRLQEKSLVKPLGDIDCILPNRQNGPVLVDNVQFVDSPKNCVPAVVWFQAIDQFYRFWPDALYFSCPHGFVSSFILRNRKSHSCGGLRVGRSDRQSICQVIESTSEIVDYVASDGEHREIVDREIFSPVDYMSELRVLISETKIFALVPRSLQNFLEVTEILFGPFDF